MESSVLFWWVLFAVLVGLIIVVPIRAWHKGGVKRFKYELKSQWNYLAYILNIWIALYLMLIGLIPVNYIKTWVINNINSPVPWMKPSVLIAYMLILLLLAILVVVRGLLPKIKFNDEEKQWEKEGKERFNNKVRQWLHFKPKMEQK